MASTILAKMAVQISANSAQLVAATQQGSKSLLSLSRTAETAGKLITGYFGAQAIFSGIKYGVGVLAGFEHKMNEVRAVTGATGEQFRQLQKNATDLGASTEYTATQVAGLQAEFGRLGFRTKEILDSTKATVNLATATGSDLARSAEIAGSTLRAFQLDAKEMGRVTDVMTSSFNKSALQLDNFAESIKYVAPIAQAAGVSIEQTTAYLAALADSGIKGSQAGTAMRRIFAELSKDGRPVADRMAELAAKGLTLSDSFDEVGRYAQTALLVLSKNNDKVKDLTKTFQEAQGEAKRTADIMRDDLTGDFKLLTSAIDGAIQKGTILSAILRELTQGSTNFINNVSGANAGINALEALAIDLNAGGRSLDFYVKNLKQVNEELGGISFSAIDISKITEGMGHAATTSQKLKEILHQLGIEITDISNKTLGPEKESLWGPPPGYNEKQILAAQAAAELNKKYQERLNLIRLLLVEYDVAADVEKALSKDSIGRLASTFTQQSTSSGLPQPGTVQTPKGLQQTVNKAVLDDYIESLKKAQEETARLAQESQNLASAFGGSLSKALDDLGEGLGNFIANGGNFGKTILASISEFMKSFGKQLIALGIAKLGLDKLFATGYGAAFAIAAGVALVAAAGALGSSGAKSVASISSGGGSSRQSFNTNYSASANDFGAGGGGNNNYTFTIKGKDLVTVLEQAQADNKIRKG